MRFRTPVMIVLALSGGMVASMVVANLTGDRAPEVAKEEMTRIYVALRDIRDGESLDERNVMLSHWPTRGLPPGFVSQIDELKSRLATGRIIAGHPIQYTHFKPVEAPSPSPSPRMLAFEVGAGSQGPWVVSTGEQVQIAPLEEIWRQAVDVARRGEPDPIEPVESAELATEQPSPTLDVINSTPLADARTALQRPTEAAPFPTEQPPWMSSIVTPEGAKILRWRRLDPNSVTGREAKPEPVAEALAAAPIATSNAMSALVPGQRCDLVGQTLTGQAFDWAAYRGRPVLVVVYLARSSACREELALVERLADAHRHRGLQVVGVGLDEDLEVVRAFTRHNQLDWPNVVGPIAREWARAARLESALSLVVISGEGRVAAIGHRAQEIAMTVASACSNSAEPLSPVREARRAEPTASQP